MKVSFTGIEGLWVVDPVLHGDRRGFFFESYQKRRYRDAGIDCDFVQDNISRSVEGVLRGLHFQVKRPQAQIVTVLRGRVFDVAVDLRPRSATFGRWFGVILCNEEGPRQLCMMPGFAHGYYVLSEVADLHYKVSRHYDADDEGGVRWSDGTLDIKWPDGPRRISPRDAGYPALRELTHEQLPHDPPAEDGDP